MPPRQIAPFGPDASASLYRHTARGLGPGPSLVREQADVAVIGGGYTGLWSALECARLGLSVVLLEAHHVGAGASGRNGGQAIPGWRKGVSELAGLFGPDRARLLFGMALEAREAVLGTITGGPIDCELRADGHLTIAARPGDAAGLRAEADALSAIAGYSRARFLTSGDVRERVACRSSAGGLLDEGGFQVHPLKYAVGLARLALGRGVRIFEETPVREIRETTTGVRLVAGRGEVNARHAVLACDAMLGDLHPPIAPAIMPVAAYQIATAPLRDPDRFIAGGLAVSDTRFAVNYYRISADGRIIFGGGERYRPQPPADMAAFVRPFLERVFPHAAEAPIEHAWGGLVSITRSRLPDIGQAGRILHAHGFSGQGVILTALAGRVIAEALAGSPERLRALEGLAPKRFPGGGFLRGPLYIAGMLYHAARDRI